jgi:hypothetical protein
MTDEVSLKERTEIIKMGLGKRREKENEEKQQISIYFYLFFYYIFLLLPLYMHSPPLTLRVCNQYRTRHRYSKKRRRFSYVVLDHPLFSDCLQRPFYLGAMVRLTMSGVDREVWSMATEPE